MNFSSQNISGTLIYLTEVLTAIETLHLKYGVISRTDPLRLVAPVHLLRTYCVAFDPTKRLRQQLSCRFMVECRYSATSAPEQSVSVGVMIKTPSSSLPSKVTSDGLYTVHLRIAKGKVFKFLNESTRCVVTFLGLHFSVVHFLRQSLLELLSRPQSAPAGALGHPALP